MEKEYFVKLAESSQSVEQQRTQRGIPKSTKKVSLGTRGLYGAQCIYMSMSLVMDEILIDTLKKPKLIFNILFFLLPTSIGFTTDEILDPMEVYMMNSHC